MMTTETKSIRWLKYVSGWLNKFNKSSLSDPSNLLLERLRRECDRKEMKKAWSIIEDLDRLRQASDGLEPAEICLQCGLSVAEMGNFREAQRLFSEASTKYLNSFHHQAVALWMKGCMDWLLPNKEVEAINSWREAEKRFKAIRDKENKKSRLDWYDARCKEMHDALHQAAEKYQIPPLPAETPENKSLFAEMATNNSREDAEQQVRSDRVGLFSIHESINAGDFGPSGMLNTPIEGMVEVEQVFIEDKPYRIVSVDGHSFFRSSTHGTAVIKVSGDSMNLANIGSGDYVLLRFLPKNPQVIAEPDESGDMPPLTSYRNGDIVAAEIINDEGDGVTLKRIVVRGGRIVLQPQSSNPVHVEREFNISDPHLYICGVVQAIFKPL
ncbi:MAG TPA: S24 family peptidase [Anaerolineales bacterium]|nr:S24 family peptidase [Anaerolineales bacterium]